MDLVADFARPLPFSVINDVLGVPPGDRDWLDAMLTVLNRGFAGLLDQRTAEPADDLMTAPAARHAEGEDRQDLRTDTDTDTDGVACPAGQPRLLFLAAANRAPPPSLTLTGSTSAATPTRTSASPPERTSASAPRLPGCTVKSR
jgi:cytochrome P450